MPGATHRNGTPSALTAQRRALAVELAVQGHSYAQIGRRLKVDTSTAWRAVMAALRENVPENVAELRTLEGLRLDALLAAWWPLALSGNARAAEVVLRTIERRCRLFGLDAPQRLQATVSAELDAEIEALIAQLAETAAQPRRELP